MDLFGKEGGFEILEKKGFGIYENEGEKKATCNFFFKFRNLKGFFLATKRHTKKVFLPVA